LTASKRTCELNLNEEADRAILHEFMKEADVIIQGYRLGSLERKGFGLNDFLTVANDRGRGVVYLDENCFGPDGYWAEKPGWQQIADAAAGSSYVIGSAYGFKDGESVLPSLPISDLSTGIVGLVTTLMALRDRGKYGGSYHGTAAITAYNMTTLLPQIGLYPPEIVARLQKKFEFSKMTADLHVLDLFLMIFRTWQNKTSLIRNDQFFVSFEKTPYRKSLRILAPVTKFADAEASPHWLGSPVPFCHFESLEWGV
jgi:crotonobetainyl-CoA:carnitine CoA-transferase CaiB-like acyl-CoA transferase